MEILLFILIFFYDAVLLRSTVLHARNADPSNSALGGFTSLFIPRNKGNLIHVSIHREKKKPHHKQIKEPWR
jgi:hypothetical protein